MKHKTVYTFPVSFFNFKIITLFLEGQQYTHNNIIERMLILRQNLKFRAVYI